MSEETKTTDNAQGKLSVMCMFTADELEFIRREACVDANATAVRAYVLRNMRRDGANAWLRDMRRDGAKV